MYNQDELDTIRKILSTHITMTSEEQEALLGEHKSLIQTVENDPIFQKYGHFAFFPIVYDLIFKEEKSVSVTSWVTPHRGLGATLEIDGKKYVIKPVQSVREPSIAKLAGELEVGPIQYQSIDNFLTEEFIAGEKFTKQSEKVYTPENAIQVGQKYGQMLKKLHEANIFYNDTSFAGEFGKSHLLVQWGFTPQIIDLGNLKPVAMHTRLIDFGVAISVADDKNYSDEEVYDYARSLPLVGSFLPEKKDKKAFKTMSDDFKEEMNKLGAKGLLERDLQFVEEGLVALCDVGKKKIASFFYSGFRETYY